MFSFLGSILRAWQKVVSRSLTATGRSLTSVPSAEVAPMTWPPLIPPPARATLKARGKWSRPALRVDLGRAAELAHPDRPASVEHARAASGRSPACAKPGSTWPASSWPCVVDCSGACPSRRSGPRRTSRPPRPAAGPAGSPGRTGCGRRRRGARRPRPPGRTPSSGARGPCRRLLVEGVVLASRGRRRRPSRSPLSSSPSRPSRRVKRSRGRRAGSTFVGGWCGLPMMNGS